ncbi:MAG: hypothetical protein ACRBCT_01475 [Alphaproteobacteria bacterium]
MSYFIAVVNKGGELVAEFGPPSYSYTSADSESVFGTNLYNEELLRQRIKNLGKCLREKGLSQRPMTLAVKALMYLKEAQRRVASGACSLDDFGHQSQHADPLKGNPDMADAAIAVLDVFRRPQLGELALKANVAAGAIDAKSVAGMLTMIKCSRPQYLEFPRPLPGSTKF